MKVRCSPQCWRSAILALGVFHYEAVVYDEVPTGVGPQGWWESKQGRPLWAGAVRVFMEETRPERAWQVGPREGKDKFRKE